VKKYPYPKAVAGAWEPIERHLKIACCHCGLCHDIRFKVLKGRLWWKVEQDPPATRKSRKAKVYECQPGRKGLDAKAKRVRS
jgi:hypothetical protein